MRQLLRRNDWLGTTAGQAAQSGPLIYSWEKSLDATYSRSFKNAIHRSLYVYVCLYVLIPQLVLALAHSLSLSLSLSHTHTHTHTHHRVMSQSSFKNGTAFPLGIRPSRAARLRNLL